MPFRALFLGWLLVVAMSAPAAAQEPDPLDWRRYIPLANGNEWHYSAPHSAYPVLTWAVVRDSLVQDREYKVLRVSSFDTRGGLQRSNHLVIRYDTTVAMVVGLEDRGDGVREYWFPNVPCDLDAPFDSKSECPNPQETPVFSIWGQAPSEAEIGGFPYPIASTKTYGTLGSEVTLGADIGILIRSADGTGVVSRLEFAHVDGKFYGTRLVSIEDRWHPGRAAGLYVYPNPSVVGRQITVGTTSTDGPTSVTMYDSIGRVVESGTIRIPSGSFARIDTWNWVPGVYHIVGRSRSGVNATSIALLRR